MAGGGNGSVFPRWRERPTRFVILQPSPMLITIGLKGGNADEVATARWMIAAWAEARPWKPNPTMQS